MKKLPITIDKCQIACEYLNGFVVYIIPPIVQAIPLSMIAQKASSVNIVTKFRIKDTASHPRTRYIVINIVEFLFEIKSLYNAPDIAIPMVIQMSQKCSFVKM